MLTLKAKRRGNETARAAATLARITSSIGRLDDESLLDLADIFDADTESPLRPLAAAEMAKRGLSL